MRDLLPVLIGLLTVVALVTLLVPRTRFPAPVLLAIGGVGLGLLPGLPHVDLSPELILLGFLPPLLYADSFQASWHDFRRWLRPIMMLGIGLVAFTILVVGVVAHAVLPELPWPVCFLLGAVVSPSDTVAVQSVIERLRIPRRMTAVLSGESLVNDATGLLGVQVGIATIASGVFHARTLALDFLLIGGGGVVAGLVVGGLAVLANRKARQTQLLFVLSLLAPYLAFLAAHAMHASGVLAVVVAGFFVSWRIHEIPPVARVELTATWDLLTYVLNSFCFVLIGIETPHLFLETRAAVGTQGLLIAGAAVSAAVIVARILWTFPGAYLPLALSRRLREHEGGFPNVRAVAIVSWCGARGVVSLAAALAVPLATSDGEPFPGRDQILACTLAVILITLCVQAPTLYPLIEWFGIRTDEASEAEVRNAREALLKSGIARLDEFCSEVSCPVSVHHWRSQMMDELLSMKAADSDERKKARSRLEVSLDVRRAVAEAHAKELLTLRDRGELNDKTFLDLQLELDRAHPEVAEAGARTNGG